MRKIYVSGSLAYDQIMNFPGKFSDHILPDKIHTLSVSFLIEEFQVNFGGTAGNIAYNLALLGEHPTIIASAGRDFDSYKEWLLRNNIDISRIQIREHEPTACAHIITDQDDNQISAFHIGAMKYPCRANSIDDVKNAALAIVAPGNVEDMVNFSRFYQRHHIPYIFDPGQNIPALSKDQLIEAFSGAKILICNDYEFSMIVKKTGFSRSDILHQVQILITTFGPEGSLIEVQNEHFRIPAVLSASASDPTGAGDAYRAGFMKGMFLNLSWEDCARLGATVAMFAVQEYGTQRHVFTQDQLAQVYEENFQVGIPLAANLSYGHNS